MWLTMAVFAAFFAGITSILAKCGIKETDSDVATAVRTVVVLVFSWIMVFAAGSWESMQTITTRSLVFLLLSGMATGGSWICYFKALSMGDVNKVVPIDKSSTILSVLFAMILFQETEHLVTKLLGTLIFGVGILFMVEKKQGVESRHSGRWQLYAVLSAVLAAGTSILAKIGIAGVESNLGTAIRTSVVLVMAWLIVLMKGKQKQVKRIDRKELAFISLSGVATGASWLCYYYAIQNGVVSVVVPVDKLSIVITVIFSYIVFGEKLSRKAYLGLLLMVFGTLVLTIWS